MHRLRSSQYFLKSADAIVFKQDPSIWMLIKSISKLSKRCFIQNTVIGYSYKHSPCVGIINNRTTLSNSHNCRNPIHFSFPDICNHSERINGMWVDCSNIL